MSKETDILDRLWRCHDSASDLAQEAEERGWPDALLYHKTIAQKYLGMIDFIVKMREEEDVCRRGKRV